MKRLACLTMLLFATRCPLVEAGPLDPPTEKSVPKGVKPPEKAEPTKVEVVPQDMPLPVNVTSPPVTNWAQVLTAVVSSFIGLVYAVEKAISYWKTNPITGPDMQKLVREVTDNVIKEMKGQP